MIGRMHSARLKALEFVADWTRPTNGAAGISALLSDARTVAQFIEGTSAAIRIRVGPVRKQTTGTISVTQPGGPKMQLHDDEQVTYTLSAVDAKGFSVVGENFSATSDDTTTVTVTEGDEGVFLAVAGNVGSAILTFTDGTLTVTEAVDVVAGDAATIQVTAGAPEKQPVPSV